MADAPLQFVPIIYELVGQHGAALEHLKAYRKLLDPNKLFINKCKFMKYI